MTTPAATSARTGDYLAGGPNWTEADRAAGDAVGDVLGRQRTRQLGMDNRLFAARAAGWAMEHVTQIVDLGCGFAGAGQAARHARSVRPGVGAAYVDNDPEVCDHLEAVLWGDMSAAWVRADIRDPAAVLSSPDLLKVVVPAKPVLILATAVFHYMPPGEAAKVAAAYMRLAAPRSLLAVSCLRVDDDGLWAQMRQAYPCAPAWNFTEAEFRGLFAGLELAEPGIGAAGEHWRPGRAEWAERLNPAGPAWVAAGIGRKLSVPGQSWY